MRSADHPRSRGVYDGAGKPKGAVWGSSPLARGLPGGADPQVGDGWIIPARAGFTPSVVSAASGNWDHPRSRGVYSPSGAVRYRRPGSSPLARGLRVYRVTFLVLGRIIPARAGFTPAPTTRRPALWDHPRSRGVYCPTRRFRLSGRGSSPLARGLLLATKTSALTAWIIPARAGFTGESARGTESHQDHPRSRGVYSVTPKDEAFKLGSSPLARGLPAIMPPPPTIIRIIPARAGFTLLLCVMCVLLEGSSPLARGLRGPTRRSTAALGIIPARAGFTGGGQGMSILAGDHPRSRGVYRAIAHEN